MDTPARSQAVDLEPETILPSQFFSGLHIDASLQAETRLMLAVLEDAVGTFQKYANARDRRGQTQFTETEEWFASDEAEWPFSFVNVCHALGLEVSYLLAGWNRKRITLPASVSWARNVIRFPFRRVNGTR